MPVFNNVLAGAAGQGAGYEIERSLRFNSEDSSKLYRTATAGNRQRFTLSWWMKRCVINESNRRIFGKSTGSQQFSIMHDANGRFYLYFNLDSPSDTSSIVFAPQYRDPNAWAHYVLAFDSTQGTDSNRIKFYYNGVQVTNFEGAPNWPTQNASFKWNNASDTYYIGGIGTYHINAYLAEIHHVDGEQLDCTSFGEFDEDTGVWNPIKYNGTYGTNGFYLDFADNSSTTSGSNSGIGKDVSGNGNYWDSSNISPKNNVDGFNFDSTSTPFTDVGTGLSVTNINSTSTVTATSNSFNLTNVADFTYTNNPSNDNYLRFATSQEVPTSYTIDYYYRLDSNSQPSNATVINIGNERIRDYGSQTGRTIRLRDTDNVHTDYNYSVSANSWNHVRVTPTGIWLNGSQINSSPRNIGGTNGALTIGSYSSSASFIMNGQVGPVRISPSNLGAPPAYGLAANSDGTLTTQSVANSGCDSLIDSPTNYEANSGNNGGNYATWNRLLVASQNNVTNGNLDLAHAASQGWTGNNQGSNYQMVVGTMGMTTGKWYWEVTLGTMTNASIGLMGSASGHNYYPGYSANGVTSSWGWGSNATNYNTSDLTVASTPTSYAAGDTLGFAYDADNGYLYCHKNGTYLNSGNPAAGTGYHVSGYTGTQYFCAGKLGSTAQINLVLNAGQRPFLYTPPTGFKSVCTQNLNDPLIANGSNHFDVSLWPGNSGTTTISGLNFSPDWVWLKSRSTATYAILQDTVRGYDKAIYLGGNSGLSAEATITDSVTSFNTDGYTLGSRSIINYTGRTYVGWAWDGGDLVTTSDTTNYNQTQTWSNDITTSNGWTTDRDGTKAFDSNTQLISGASNTWAQTDTTGGTVTWTPNGYTIDTADVIYVKAISSSDRLTVVGSSSTQNNIAPGTVNGVSNVYTVPTTLGTVNSLSVTNPSGLAGFSGIEVGGKILIDPGVIPAGSLNSSLYDQSQRWRNYLTSDIGWHSSYPVSAAFNGVFDGGGGAATNGSNGTVTFSPPAAITVTSMELSVYSTVTVTFPDGTTTTVNGVASNDAYRTVSLPAGFNFTGSNSITLTSSGYVYIERIRINGKELVDDDVTVTNVPSVNTTARANPTAGFSIATFNTPSPSAEFTYDHGLNAAPEFVIHKFTGTNSNWYTYHASLGQPFMNLNDTSSKGSNQFTTAPTSSVFTYPAGLIVGPDEPMVAYSFTSVEGYSAFGSYEGNASADGRYVWTGFRPAFLLTKWADSVDQWQIHDTTRSPDNVAKEILVPNTATAEQDYEYSEIDILSNGFKVRTPNQNVNAASTYIYAAFAENPFKYARAR